jgi:hypothetical protein
LLTISAPFYKKNTLFFTFLVIFFIAFTADILDVRDEVHILSCPYSSLDNNVSTGLISQQSVDPEFILIYRHTQWRPTDDIPLVVLRPYSIRAPPSSLS